MKETAVRKATFAWKNAVLAEKPENKRTKKPLKNVLLVNSGFLFLCSIHRIHFV